MISCHFCGAVHHGAPETLAECLDWIEIDGIEFAFCAADRDCYDGFTLCEMEYYESAHYLGYISKKENRDAVV